MLSTTRDDSSTPHNVREMLDKAIVSLFVSVLAQYVHIAIVMLSLLSPLFQETLSSSELYTIPPSGRRQGGIVEGLLQVRMYVCNNLGMQEYDKVTLKLLCQHT